MTTDVAEPSAEEVLEHLRHDTPLWCDQLAKIRTKDKRVVRFVLNDAQRALEGMLAAQREAGKPQRLIALKARQVGVSTYVQAKLIQGGTLMPNFSGLCLAHDRETGAKLYQMGDRMYRNLPNEPELRPPVRHYQRARFMHWGAEQVDGTLFPDSSYLVDTAGEAEAGRGGSYTAVHASEFAFWPNPIDKLTALQGAVPDDDPDSLFVIESTANGGNYFKDLWDAAFGGHSEWAAFFWPWWKEPGYARPFVNEAEREAFKIGEGPYAEGEQVLVDPGPIDTTTGLPQPLTLEQLHWRRWMLANKYKLDKFKQEYPATPEEAFVATGRKVFDPTQVAFLLAATEKTDPRIPTEENPGPLHAKLVSTKTEKMVGRLGPIEVQVGPKFKPRRELGPLETAEWKLWVPEPDPKTGYVIGVDVSEGISDSDPEDGEPAYHAIEVIDHKTGLQAAEYVSRIDPDLLARECYLAALFFNQAYVAVEKTGPGNAVVLRLYHDYHYPFTYFRKDHDRRSNEKVSDRLGWDTSRATKPILIANAEEMLREGSTGIRSRELASEMQTYVRAQRTAKTLPERGKFSDRLMAWMIAKQVALEKPLKLPDQRRGEGIFRTYQARDPVTG